MIQPVPDNQRSALMDLIRQQDHERLRRMLKNLGERCQELLKRWSEDGTDEESAKEFGYNSAGVVQTTRLRCLEKLREMYKN